MRPEDEELILAYMRDLEVEIECNKEAADAGRTDFIKYDAAIRKELAALKEAREKGTPIRVTRYGIPYVVTT